MRRRLRSLLWRVPVEQEVREELAHHRELRYHELIDRGWTPEAARAEADRRLEGVAPALTRLGEGRDRAWARREWLEEFGQDLRFALRQCRLQPGFTAAAVLTLALGIGATTAIFSVVHAVVLKPFPFPDPDRVLHVYTTQNEGRGNTSAGNFAYLHERVTSLEHFAAGAFASFNLADDETPERVVGLRVTWPYFHVFGVPALHGRTFTADDDQPGRAEVVVLSHRLWQRRYGADPSIIGRSIRMNGIAHEVVGVLGPDFDTFTTQLELWVPMAFTADRLAMYDEHYLELYGRRHTEATLAQVNDELSRAAEGLVRDHPQFNVGRGAGAEVFGQFMIGDSRARLFVLLGAVGLVLLIACGNVANLWLARLASRARELAIRAAIGAGRGRIIRQILTESLVLAGLGGLGGVLLAYWMLPALVASAPVGVPRLATAAIDTSVLAAVLGLVAASAFAVGCLPSWHATRSADLRATLGDGKGTASGALRPWVRQALIAVEAALVLVVLAGAALLVRSAMEMQQVPIGFDTRGILSARVGLIGDRYAEPAVVKDGFRRLLAGLQQAPGVALATLDSQPPLVTGGGGSNGLIPEGRPLEMASIINSRTHFVTPDYFRLLGVPLRTGRHFSDADIRSAPLVMIINETLAREAFGQENPIGKRMTCCEGSPEDPMWKTVVGVVADVRSQGPAMEVRPEFYLPLAQVPDVAWGWIQNSLTVLVRPVSGDAVALAGAVRAAVNTVDPTLPIYNLSTIDEGLRRVTAQARFNTQLMSLLGLTGLLLAAIGIYSVVAWLVAQRTREIGVRMALGAPATAVVRQVALHGLTPVAVGLLFGVAGAVGAGRLLEAQLFRVEAADPIAIGGVVLLMLLVGLIAALIPAWRAAAIDPAVALHES
ncbi:MAG: ABC transporter permease [Vicinamibacterales bacterium]|nr:ABC transporter permease [Vicinamibacterales bacterium]